MSGWNLADIWETVARAQPEATAVVQGSRCSTWAEYERRANGVAARLLAAPGVEPQAKVAEYLYNSPEYLETLFAAWKAGLVPVNTNYRYTDDELVYLWDNADTVAVVFHGAFTPTIERIRDRLPRIRLWLWVDDATGPMPEWAEPYEAAATSGPADPVAPPWGRSGDDLLMLYTGGTTGSPKGTMWRQDDLFVNLNAAGLQPYSVDGGLEKMGSERAAWGAGPRAVPACPLMHGTALFITIGLLTAGGSSILLEKRNFDATELFDVVDREKVNGVIIVGDAFARPMVKALDEHPGRWDLSSLLLIYSSGVMWSEPVKEALLAHHPNMALADLLGSSEALGMAKSVSGGTKAAATATFELSDDAVVLTDDNRVVQAGSGEIGRVALKGRVPVGYYKDPEKSARTFPVIDGVRYTVPGDYATVEADGSITLLGRGSVVINTGGEKVFPEEVEEAMKTFDGVRDAVAVGVPDERFGEAVTGVVELDPGASVDAGALREHVKRHLAAFKAPHNVVVVDTIGRAANGKVDYRRLKELAIEHLA
ncbi:MAG: fatty-acid--CoA ligase [Acidimicrobiales bacterium]|nr:fatty-acid--CoA ligase [Acidimicrobiales bacterium]